MSPDDPDYLYPHAVELFKTGVETLATSVSDWRHRLTSACLNIDGLRHGELPEELKQRYDVLMKESMRVQDERIGFLNATISMIDDVQGKALMREIVSIYHALLRYLRD